MELQEKLARTKMDLDRVSPSFCLAKWLQVTLHLQNGFSHSCHHPDLHKIPLIGLDRDPSALHNTPFKKEMRKLMLRGERPKECEYCWKVEDTAGGHFSDRILKSSDAWAAPRLKEIAARSHLESVNPSYMEVSFGNECNFRCSYCAPHISSSLWSSYEKHGPFVGRAGLDQTRAQDRAPIKADENPYLKAFWDWFPSLVRDLKVFRITGGEPLVNPNTYRVLDYLDQNPEPNLQLCINSNFGVPERHFQRFLEKVTTLTRAGKIRDFMMYTSVDTHGAQAEYIRTGLRYEDWLGRVRTFLEALPWNLTFMVTFNALSPARFPLLLEDLRQVNRDFAVERDGVQTKRTLLDISHLLHPEYFSPWVLTPRWIREIEKLAHFMEERSSMRLGAEGFYEYEIHKMKRIAAWAKLTTEAPSRDPAYFRALFRLFTAQYEEREGKKFLEVFPEMADYYEACESALAAQGEEFVHRHLPARVDSARAPGPG